MSGIVATETQSAEWWNLVAQFREAASSVDQVLATLRSQEGTARRDAALSSEYDAIMGRAASLRSTIADYLGKIETAMGWFRQVVPFSESSPDAPQGTWEAEGWGLNGLGAIPIIIGVAAISAALAAVTKFLTDAWSLARRLQEQARLEASGLSPQEAAAVVERTVGESAASSIVKSAGKVVLLGLAAWVGWRLYETLNYRGR